MLYKALTCALVGYANAFTAGGAMSFRSTARTSAVQMATLQDFSLTKIDGSAVDMSSLKGKPVLVLNVASLWGTTTADFTAMNALAEKYGDKVSIIGFPCNQFGHQTNEGNDEFLNTLQYVRPGNGFKPADSIIITEKGYVNGADADPLFKWMKSEALIPCDEYVDTKENGVANPDALVLPRDAFGGSTVVLWTPVARSDIAWNFEKFLLDGEGKMVKRYSRYYDTNAIASDIDALL